MSGRADVMATGDRDDEIYPFGRRVAGLIAKMHALGWRVVQPSIPPNMGPPIRRISPWADNTMVRRVPARHRDDEIFAFGWRVVELPIVPKPGMSLKPIP